MAGSGGDLTTQLTRIMSDYSRTSEEKIQKILQDVGKEAKQKLNRTSPKRPGGGAYRRGWKVTLQRRNGNTTVHIHNKIYRLVHLLEKGHVSRRKHRGRPFVDAKVHVQPVDEWAKNEVERRIREELRG